MPIVLHVIHSLYNCFYDVLIYYYDFYCFLSQRQIIIMEEEAAPVRRNVCRCKLIGAHDETCKCYETDEIVRMRKKIKELNDHTHDGLEVFSKVTTKVYSMTKCVKLLLNFADKIIADYVSFMIIDNSCQFPCQFLLNGL